VSETVSLFPMPFNRAVQVESRPELTSSDGGALLLRQVLEDSKVTEFLERELHDSRMPGRIVHSAMELLRTLVLQAAQGWRDQSDVHALKADPIFALACSDRRGQTPLDRPRPSQASLSRFIDLCAGPKNQEVLQEGLLRLAEFRFKSGNRGHGRHTLMLDVDGMPVVVHGHQGGSAFNAYAGDRIYSPLIASVAETGDMLGALLREGNAGPAQDAATWIPRLVNGMKARKLCRKVIVRFDAGFTGDRTLRALEAEQIPYLGRLTGNSVLDAKAGPRLKRPPGRPPEHLREWVYDETHQAGSWDAPRRTILVVQERDDLFLHHFWIVTNLPVNRYPPEAILDLYRKRGKAEKHMGELKSRLDLHLSSTDRGCSTVQQVMARNQATLLLAAYAYQLLHTLRCIQEKRTHRGWSIGRLREQLLKVAVHIRLQARQIRASVPQHIAEAWCSLERALAQRRRYA